MHYDLDLAIAYACVLGLFCWLASWFVPLAFRALYRALAIWVENWSGHGPRGTPPGATSARTAQSDWWGPTHHAR